MVRILLAIQTPCNAMRSISVQHTPHDNGGAARDWKVLSIRPPLRGAMAFHDISLSPTQERQ